MEDRHSCLSFRTRGQARVPVLHTTSPPSSKSRTAPPACCSSSATPPSTRPTRSSWRSSPRRWRCSSATSTPASRSRTSPPPPIPPRPAQSAPPRPPPRRRADPDPRPPRRSHRHLEQALLPPAAAAGDRARPGLFAAAVAADVRRRRLQGDQRLPRPHHRRRRPLRALRRRPRIPPPARPLRPLRRRRVRHHPPAHRSRRRPRRGRAHPSPGPGADDPDGRGGLGAMLGLPRRRALRERRRGHRPHSPRRRAPLRVETQRQESIHCVTTMPHRYAIANWKMNLPPEGVEKYLAALGDAKGGGAVVVAPPFPFLKDVYMQAPKSVGVAAQNCADHQSVAYTGEVSPSMLRYCGAPYVIIGHSERRNLFGENDALIARKLALAIETGLTPVFCIGGDQNARARGKQSIVGSDQIKVVEGSAPASAGE